jgi:hypothetical protein
VTTRSRIRMPRRQRRGLSVAQVTELARRIQQRRQAEQIAIQAEQQARAAQSRPAPIPQGLVGPPPGSPGLFSQVASAITSPFRQQLPPWMANTMLGGLAQVPTALSYLEKASRPFQYTPISGALAIQDIFGKAPGREAVEGLGFVESFQPAKLEEAFSQTRLPTGVMGAIETFVDPIGGVGKASSAYRLATQGGRRLGLAAPSPDALFGPQGREARTAFLAERDAALPAVHTLAPTSVPSLPNLLRADVTPSRTMRELHDLQIGNVKPLAWFAKHLNASAVLEPDDVVGNSALGYNRVLEWGDNTWEPMKGKLGYLWNNSGIKIERVKADWLGPGGGIRASVRGRLGLPVEPRRVENWVVVNAKPVLGAKGARARPLLQDFLERRGAYHYTSAQQKFLDGWDELSAFITKAQKAEGVPVKELVVPGNGKWFSRLVLSIRGEATRPGVRKAVGAKQPTQRARWHEFAQDGAERKVEYSGDPIAAMEIAYKGAIHSIADRRLATAIKNLPGVRSGKASVATRLEKTVAQDQLDTAMKLHRVARIARKAVTRGIKRVGKLEDDLSNLRVHLRDVTTEIAERGTGPESLRAHTISWLRDSRASTRSSIRALEKGLNRLGGPGAGTAPLRAEGISRSVAGSTTSKIERVFPGTNVRELLREGNPEQIKALLDESVTRVAGARRRLNAATREHAKSKAASQAIRPGEAVIRQPAFNGSYFPQEVADDVNRILAPQLDKMLERVQTVSGIARSLGTVFDLGWKFIQGLVFLTSKPHLWAKVAKMEFEALFDPRAWERFMSDPVHYGAAQRLTAHGGAIQAAGELVEAAAKGGAFERLPVVGYPLSKAAGPFERAFTFGGNAARVLWWEALENTAAKHGKQGLDELADFVGKATGVMSQGNLGISRQQQAAESMLLFAPRFTKAAFGLITDALQGGLRGELARDSLVKLATAGTMVYIITGKALGQTPHLNPLPASQGGDGGKFMTYRILGQNVGMPGAFMSIVRLLGHSVATLDQNPSAFLSLSPRDQPFIRFLRGKMSPVASATWDTVAGRTFIGEPTREDALQWSTEVVGSRMMPFWAESYLFSNPRPGVGGIGEFMGLRTFPVSLWERRNDLRQQYSDDRWDELTRLEQRALEQQHPDLLEAAEKARDLSVGRGDELTLLIDEQSNKFHEAREEFIATIQTAQDEFEQTDVSPARFKDKFGDAGRLYRARLDNIQADARYAEVGEFFKELDSEKSHPFADVAYDMYISEVVANPDLEDRFGNYDYDMRKRLEDEFKVKWGEPVWQYVRQVIEQSRQDEPLLARELRDGRENPLFRAYFETDKLALDNIGRPELLPVYREYRNADSVRREEMAEAMPILKQIDSAISRARIRMRERNRVLDGFLFRFGYTTTVRHEDNIGREATILDFGTR